MKNYWNLALHIAKHPKVKYYWKDLRENPRYARYGIMSALLATCVTAFEYYPLPAMGYNTLMWLFGNPVMRTVYTLASGCGYTLAFLLGMVAVFRPALIGSAYPVAQGPPGLGDHNV